MAYLWRSHAATKMATFMEEAAPGGAPHARLWAGAGRATGEASGVRSRLGQRAGRHRALATPRVVDDPIQSRSCLPPGFVGHCPTFIIALEFATEILSHKIFW